MPERNDRCYYFDGDVKVEDMIIPDIYAKELASLNGIYFTVVLFLY